ncbi:MAG TPA: preprotein translocase subunit YajC [Actinomycetota bacterium]|nr:preprotein translocase subunit YajC [Actinomycetota bacterium]
MIATLLAQAQTQQPRGNATFLISLGLMVAIFYFLLIRPQQRRVRQQRDLVSALQVGDEVVTIGGMYGRIRGMSDDEVSLEISPGTEVRFVKQAIARRLVPEPLEGEGSGGA